MSVKRGKIHPTAILGDEVEIEGDVEIGPYSLIEGEVKIGAGTKLGPGVVLKGPLRIGRGNEFHAFVVIGDEPQHVEKGKGGGVIIGDGNVFREYVTVHAGTGDSGTRIGDNNYFMVGTHVAHDCQVGNNNIFANWVSLAGHVEVGDYNFFGGYAGVHQFARVGFYCMIAAGAMVPKDVAPFCLVSGDRARYYGINVVGLRRAGFSKEEMEIVRRITSIFFRENLLVNEALQKIEAELGEHRLARLFVDFVRNSTRGVVK